MSDDRRHNDPQPPDRDAGRALAVLSRLPRCSAPESAKESARLAFLHGSVDQAESSPRLVKPIAEPIQKPIQKSSSRRWVSMLMAAALGMVAVFWFGSQPAQQWIIMDIKAPEGIAMADGKSPAVGNVLASGLMSTGPESEMAIQLGEKLRFTMLPGTSLDLPKPPGRWFDRGRRLPLTSGEIYGTTGGQTLGFDLVFSTQELEARLTGTTFAVFRTEVASCVCLWEGGIAVTPLVGQYGIVNLEELHRVWIYKDGRAPEVKTLDANETMKLQMTEDAGVAELPDEAQ